MNKDHTARPSAKQLLGNVGSQLRGARQSRAAHRLLTRELATYRTASDVNDLLGSLRGQEGADVEVIRHILTRNLQQQQRPRHLVA